jgi:hypothetical protein
MTHSRTLIGFAAAVLLAGAAWADDASKMAKADELLRLTKGDQNFKPLLARAQAMLKADAVRKVPADAAKAAKAAIEQKISQILSEEMSWDKLRPQFVKLYADKFTEEELDGILAFYKSPLGQAWNTKSAEVTAEAVKVSGQAMQDAQAQIRKVIEQATPKEPAPQQ